MSEIAHEAVVTDINNDTLSLEIVRTEACNSCAIKSVCQQKKNLNARVENPQNYKKGQKINVYIEEKQAFNAIVFAYILPLILVLLALFSVIYFMGDEVIAAIISLLVFPIYYLVLYCFGKKLKMMMSVKIEQP